MAREAASTFGAVDPLARFLQEVQGFFLGEVVYPDDVLVDEAGRTKLLRVLDGATDRLLQEDVFTRVGVEWIAAAITVLRRRITGIDGVATTERSDRSAGCE